MVPRQLNLQLAILLTLEAHIDQTMWLSADLMLQQNQSKHMLICPSALCQNSRSIRIYMHVIVKRTGRDVVFPAGGDRS